jgi:hypothetical protein
MTMTNKPIITLCALAGTLFMMACTEQVSQTSANVLGLNSIASVQRAAQATPTEKDLAMSCAQIDAELKTLYARTEEINKAERARERKAGLTQGLLDAGLSVVGASAIANAGSAQAISNVGTATALAGSASSAAVGSGGPNQKAYNQALALAERSSVLERAKVEKGC